MSDRPLPGQSIPEWVAERLVPLIEMEILLCKGTGQIAVATGKHSGMMFCAALDVEHCWFYLDVPPGSWGRNIKTKLDPTISDRPDELRTLMEAFVRESFLEYKRTHE